MRSSARSALALGLALTLASGCASHPTSITGPAPGNSQDQAQVLLALAAVPDLIETGESLGSFGPAPARSLVVTDSMPSILLLARRVARTEERLAFAWSDSDSLGRPRRAEVTIHRTLHGTFERTLDSTGVIDLHPHTVSKPLGDLWTRVVRLERAHGGWNVTAVSGVAILSVDHEMECAFCGLANIRKVTLRTGLGDVAVIEDPLAPLALDALPTVPLGGDVTLTVETTADDDVVGLGYLHPAHFVPGEAGHVYTLHWRVPAHLGIAQPGVSVLAHGAVFSDLPYDSAVWFLPLRVRAVGTPPPPGAGPENLHAAR